MEDFNDDEREDNEEKEIEEIDSDENEKEERFFASLINSDDSFITNNAKVINFFIERVSTYSLEIQLPPPEYNI